jgi:hypothetical protein
MSNKRITDLTELTNPTTDDVFPVVDIATNTTTKVQLGNLPVPSSVTTALATKQDSLVSGTNIKTINSNSLLGSGDVAVQETLVSGTNIKTLNNTSLLGSGNITLTANPSGVAGAIQFSNGSAFASDASNLFWDDTNNRLGVGTNAPSATAHFKGSGSTSATTSLLVQNSAGATLMSVRDDANINIGSGGITTFSGTVTNAAGPMQALNFATSSSPFNFGTASIYNITGTASAVTSGQRDGFLGQFTFAPTSGTAVLNVLNVSPTINQTGGANGITRGLYINPTLTAAADFRAIEVTNGNVLIGNSASNTAKLSIKGSGSTSATTSLLVQNSAGVASLQVLDDTSVFNNGKGAVASNTAFGNGALINNTSGSLNTAVGFEALRNNTSGSFNTANGSSALRNNTSGTFNTANGVNALSANTTGGDNTANGVNALVFNTTGSKNTAVGRSALQSNTASNNTAVGQEAALTNTTGTGITAIGYQALRLSTGANNTALGFQAGDNITTGAGNVCIGSGAEPLAATDSNQFVVGTATINAGAVTTESNLSLKVWNVIINGVAQKILLA